MCLAMKIVYRFATSSLKDSESFCSLYNSTYVRKINNDYYTWQFFSTPFPSYLFFAELHGEVVGSIGVQVKQILPKKQNALSIIDMMVSPQCRGKGVFSGLMKAAIQFGNKYLPFCAIVMANEVGKDSICGSLGWSCITEIETMQMVLKGDCTGINLSIENSTHQVFEELPGLHQNNLYHVSHNIDYYRWRFQTHPMHNYKIVRNDFSAYSILKVFQNPVTLAKYGDIIEIAGKEMNGIKEIGDRSLKQFQSMGVYTITTWMQTNTLWDQIGRELGFMGTGQMRFFCINALSNSDNKLLDSGNWFMQPSDTEIY